MGISKGGKSFLHLEEKGQMNKTRTAVPGSSAWISTSAEGLDSQGVHFGLKYGDTGDEQLQSKKGGPCF